MSDIYLVATCVGIQEKVIFSVVSVFLFSGSRCALSHDAAGNLCDSPLLKAPWDRALVQPFPERTPPSQPPTPILRHASPVHGTGKHRQCTSYWKAFLFVLKIWKKFLSMK